MNQRRGPGADSFVQRQGYLSRHGGAGYSNTANRAELRSGSSTVPITTIIAMVRLLQRPVVLVVSEESTCWCRQC